MSASGLIEARDSVLVVIDVQPPFTRKLAPGEAQALVARIGWLVGAVRWLGIPIVVTAEDVQRLGGSVDEVARRLAPETVVHDKLVFDLTGDPGIVRAIRETGRHTAILAGLETDVCVAHSAIGLSGLGYRVVALADCTGSPGPSHAAGLQRMAGAGILVTPLRNVLYEWLRTVETSRRFRAEYVQRHPLPEGLVM